MQLAVDAHISAWALNIKSLDPNNEPQLQYAFSAAQSTGLKLFLSFDYNGGNGPWIKSNVNDTLNVWTTNSAYFKYKNAPLVSTFEGPLFADDWADIKKTQDIYFIPSWSSLGAEEAWALGVADGLFSEQEHAPHY